MYIFTTFLLFVFSWPLIQNWAFAWVDSILLETEMPTKMGCSRLFVSGITFLFKKAVAFIIRGWADDDYCNVQSVQVNRLMLILERQPLFP